LDEELKRRWAVLLALFLGRLLSRRLLLHFLLGCHVIVTPSLEPSPEPPLKRQTSLSSEREDGCAGFLPSGFQTFLREGPAAMAMIETAGLRKVFRSVKRRPGIGGAIAALFSREYEDHVAVNDVSMSVEAGELVGYLGPNGAGKSTTIKMLTGILVPTGGSIRVAGLVPHKRRYDNAQNIGVVFGQRSQLYWDLPLRESFRSIAIGRTSSTSPRSSTSSGSWTRPSGNSPWASGCAATSPRR
jgi:hypothetical protein